MDFSEKRCSRAGWRGQSPKPLLLPPPGSICLAFQPGRWGTDGSGVGIGGKPRNKETFLLPNLPLEGDGRGVGTGLRELTGDGAGSVLRKDERVELPLILCPQGSV